MVNGLCACSSDGSPFQRTASEIPKTSLKISQSLFWVHARCSQSAGYCCKSTYREHTLHLGGHLIVKCFEHDTTAFCFVRLIDTLSYPSMSKRGPTVASYLDLVI